MVWSPKFTFPLSGEPLLDGDVVVVVVIVRTVKHSFVALVTSSAPG